MRPVCVLVMGLPMLAGVGIGPACLAETEVLFDGKTLEDWDTGRDAARLDREFALSELSIDGEPPALLWRFVSGGVAFNDIFLRRQTARPFSRYRARVRNEGAAFTLAAKVGDARGAEWTANRTPLTAGGDWQWVEFPREEWKPASWSRDADGKLDFPLRYFTLIAFGIRPGPEYQLRVSRIEVERPDPPVATVLQLHIPGAMKAGETYTASLCFSLDKPCLLDEAALAIRRGKTEILSLPLPLQPPLTQAQFRQEYHIRHLPIPIPRYAFGGECSLVLRLGEAHIERDGRRVDEEVQPVTIEARKAGKTLARVAMHNGTPTLFINGNPHNGMAYTAYGPSVEVFRDFAEQGINLYSFSATPTEAGYGLSKTAWVAPDEYDFSQLDERVLTVLEANPEAYLFPRLYVHAPKWWSQQNPDEIVLMDPGDGEPVPFVHAGGKPAPSWASDRWRRVTIAGLKRLIAHVEASPYADRVIGYHIASGTTEEWMMWGANENQWVGYSPANIRKFRQWLRNRYGTDEALRHAWHDVTVRLETAAVPLKAARQNTELGSLRDPQHEQAVIDFYLYNSDLVADTICHLAKAVKELTAGEKTVGVFYGYLLQLCGEQRQQNAGHLALAKVLASPHVDFLCSPTSYAFRQLGGEGTSHFMSVLGSVQLHGKLWFDENDIRTSLSPGKLGGWGRPADVDGDILQQDKELANVIVNGAAQWWFDVGRNRYDDPRLMQRIGDLGRNATEALELNRAPADEVAMVVDESSLCYMRVGDRLGRDLLIGQLPELHRIGAPVGHYLVSDVPRLHDRKVFLITTSLAPTEGDRRAIDALKQDGHVLIFLYAAGLYREGVMDEAAMQDLTGIRLRLSKEPSPLWVRVREGSGITRGLGGVEYGSRNQTWPVCFADDPEGQVLGELPDGRAGLVMKQFDGWTAVHSAAPRLPATLLRRIAAMAGVHLYVDTPDVVWASRDLLGVSVREGGTRTLRLPTKAHVRDLYTGQTIGERVRSFEADFGDRATRVFVVK